MEKSYYKSPIGNLEIVCEAGCLVSLKLTDKISAECMESAFIIEIKKQLEEYFSGKRKTFDIKINPAGTEFQKKVRHELLKIPYGSTKSYSEIARNIGKPNAQRAVGSACNKNPVMIIIPCHRVVSKSGDLTGFAYGTDVKQTLLVLESSL